MHASEYTSEPENNRDRERQTERDRKSFHTNLVISKEICAFLALLRSC